MQIYKRGSRWWVRFQHEGQEHRYSLRTTSKRQAEAASRDVYERTLRGLTPFDAPTTAPSAGALIHEYREDLERAFGFLADRSPRSQNKALGMVKSWFTWLNRTGRWNENPVASLQPVRHLPTRDERRALLEVELVELIDCEFIPEPRRLLYAVAAQTGLRRSELARLTWEDVDLERGVINLPARHAKNRKAASLYPPPELMEWWREWAADPYICIHDDEVEAYAPIQPPPEMKTWLQDLAHAGLADRDPEGFPTYYTSRGILDFHALRVTYASILARAGVPLAMAQQLLRHSDPKLTATTYTKFAPADRLLVAAQLGAKIFEAKRGATPRHKSRHSQERAG